MSGAEVSGVERIYRYVKSHRWASSLGSSLLALLETAWGHVVGLARGGTPPPARSTGATPLPEWAADDSVLEFAVPFEETTEVNSPPSSIYPADPPMFSESGSQVSETGFVAEIADGLVWRDGAVLLPNGTLVEESILVPERHPLVQGSRLPRAQSFDGRLGVLSTTYGRGFYHWVFDSMARLALMETVDPPDAYVVNFKNLAFQSEWLQALGIDLAKVYSGVQLPFVRADRVVLTQIPGRYSKIPGYVADFLSRHLRTTGSPGTGPKRVFVTRKQAARRRLVNEDEIDSILDQHGFESVALETVPLAERPALLSSAEIFLCPDGAGMTNMLFCNDATKVVELFTHRRAEPFGWNLSNRLGLPYYYIMGDEGQPGRIRPDELIATLELVLSG